MRKAEPLLEPRCLHLLHPTSGNELGVSLAEMHRAAFNSALGAKGPPSRYEGAPVVIRWPNCCPLGSESLIDVNVTTPGGGSTACLLFARASQRSRPYNFGKKRHRTPESPQSRDRDEMKIHRTVMLQISKHQNKKGGGRCGKTEKGQK